eukprot:TRINITY_DN2672_c0_g1_i1.p1 TRINITY_DN2672_c0_g1~~TRINITY_DN2672_c0_g1_i1.p1  ORF type:complete len:157 (+),score=28.54 TRINITY_DN2672_c0_g1_i1:706-1176(+)
MKEENMKKDLSLKEGDERIRGLVSVEVSPNRMDIVTATRDSKISLVDLRMWRRRGQAHSAAGTSPKKKKRIARNYPNLAWNPTGNLFAVGTKEEDCLSIWSGSMEGPPLDSLQFDLDNAPGEIGGITCLKWWKSKNEEYLVHSCGASDNNLIVWSM